MLRERVKSFDESIDVDRFVASLSPEDMLEFDRMTSDHLRSVTMGDPEWRMDHLYWIQDASGREIPFVRNDAQKQWWRDKWCLNIILKSRQLGFSTEIALEILDTCLFTPNTNAGIIDYAVDDAKKKLDKVKFAYQHLSKALQDAHPLTTENTESLGFANGSRIEVGTSHRGGTLQILHVSEFGKISSMRPDKAKEIKTGGFGTVHAGMQIHVESTAAGQGGEFHDMVQHASDMQKQGLPLSLLDFKLHFFAWWRHRGYTLDPDTVVIPKEVQLYFDDLRAKEGIRLTAGQKAWYTAKRFQMGPDNMFQEYPSTPDEAFKSSIEGAYFKRQMSQMRLDGRIGRVPYDDNRLVNTFWDIGNDTTSIWFHQTDGVRHRLIDYYEASDESIAHYAHELSDRRERFGWSYGTHYGPHDLDNTEWGQWETSPKSRKQIAKDNGLIFKVIPRIDDKNDAIDVARLFLAMCWIDEQNCQQGIRCLDNYRKKWNDQLGTWSREPFHDWASHGSDSIMCGAMGYRPERDKPKPKAQLPVFNVPRGVDHGTGWMGR